MNEKIEEYIKDLSPELQEKARQCKTKEELNTFIAENDLEISEETLEAVSGGCGTSTPDVISQNIQVNYNGNINGNNNNITTV